MTEQVERPKFNELAKFAMFTPTPGVENKRAKLAWVVRDGFPRISVNSNNPSDKVNAPISAAMNPETFMAFLDELIKIANGPNSTKMQIECYTGLRGEGALPGDKVLASNLWFGKDDDGMVWISVTAKDRPQIKFEFQISDYHVFRRPSGALSKSEASVIQACAVANSLKMIFPPFFNTFRQPGQGFQRSAKPDAPFKSSGEFEDIQF